jgi:hypothetical protein
MLFHVGALWRLDEIGSGWAQSDLQRVRRLNTSMAVTFSRRRRMLGPKLGYETGKVTAQRVLPNLGGSPKMEISYQASGILLQVQETDIVTYWTVVRPDGLLYGEGQGIVMGAGGEMATFIGQGVGTRHSDGSVSYRGATYYQSSTPKWSELNRMAAVFELEVAAAGNTKSQNWAWA